MPKDNKKFYKVDCPYCGEPVGRACSWNDRYGNRRVLGVPHKARQDEALIKSKEEKRNEEKRNEEN